MRTGELAKKAQVNIQTVRFYERRGLLREPARTPAGYRDYGQTDLESVLFIRWCQHLGFTLKEVEQLLDLHVAVAKLSFARSSRRPRELQSIVRMTEEKLANIQEKIKLLKDMAKQLGSIIENLQAAPQPVCPASKSPAVSLRTKRNSFSRRRKTS